VIMFLYALSGSVVWVYGPNILLSYTLFDVKQTFQSRHIYIYIYIYIYTVSSFYYANDLYMMISVMCFNLHAMYSFAFLQSLYVGKIPIHNRIC
jgi:hypothetical protein